MNRLRWGVLGTGQIVNKIGEAIQQSETSNWLGIAGRNETTSSEAACKFQLPRTYRSYEDLIADQDIDAVYIALLNHLHAEWAIRAIQASKHVLCEKPFTLNVAEARKVMLAAEAQNVQVMEAFVWRFHPAHQTIKKWIVEGLIGDVQSIHAHFSFDINQKRNSTRLVRAWGGGSLYDIGCYLISYIRYFMDDEPETAYGRMTLDSENQVDRACYATLHFPKNRVATFSSSFDMNNGSYYEIIGTKGRLVTHPIRYTEPFGVQIYTENDRNEHFFPVVNPYIKQIDTFAECILHGRPVPFGAADALANMRIIDALFESHNNGSPVHF